MRGSVSVFMSLYVQVEGPLQKASKRWKAALLIYAMAFVNPHSLNMWRFPTTPISPKVQAATFLQGLSWRTAVF